MSYKAFIVLAIASVILLLPNPAAAQGPINQQIRSWFEPPAPSYPGQHWQSLPAQPPISRQQLDWLNQLSGGQDQYGNLNSPVQVNRVVPQTLPNGSYRYPMQWDGDRSVVFQVQDGQILRMDYVLPR